VAAEAERGVVHTTAGRQKELGVGGRCHNPQRIIDPIVKRVRIDLRVREERKK
jgi:hypothetical protein